MNQHQQQQPPSSSTTSLHNEGDGRSSSTGISSQNRNGNNDNSNNNNNNNVDHDHEQHHDDTFLPNQLQPGHPSKTTSQLLTCTFNQDGGCLAIGTTTGFSVHNLHPMYSLSVERCLRGGIGHVEMLFRCNLMAIVGGGPTPHSAPHRVLVWDDHVPKEIGELAFRQAVLAVKLRKDTIAVALRDRVYVYTLADLSLRDKIYTADNPHGLLSLSTHVQDMVLACPSVTTGHVRVELYGKRKTVLIEAHESTVRALTLTSDGTLLATASHKGTIIRVWNVEDSSKVYEFRRGVERATITCLSFSGAWDDQWLACSSDKGTTHIFHCHDPKSAKTKHNKHNKQHNKKSRDNNNNNQQTAKSSSSSFSTSSLFSSGTKLLASPFSTSMITSSSSSESKSVCQVRGVPHPLACAFIGEAPNGNLIAVAGWDNDGNGVLLISEFAAHQEPRRVVYHVLVKNTQHDHETEEERRRRRARGWRPTAPTTPIPEQYVGHLTITDHNTDVFQTQTTDDDFCEVIVEHGKGPIIDDHQQNGIVGNGKNDNGDNDATNTTSNDVMSSSSNKEQQRPSSSTVVPNNNNDDNNNTQAVGDDTNTAPDRMPVTSTSSLLSPSLSPTTLSESQTTN